MIPAKRGLRFLQFASLMRIPEEGERGSGVNVKSVPG
jgi:hypothetical protein